VDVTADLGGGPDFYGGGVGVPFTVAVAGGPGGDTLQFVGTRTSSSLTLDGGDDNDSVSYTASGNGPVWTLIGGPGIDSVRADDRTNGTPSHDNLIAGEGNDSIQGNLDDQVDGGDGDDSVKLVNDVDAASPGSGAGEGGNADGGPGIDELIASPKAAFQTVGLQLSGGAVVRRGEDTGTPLPAASAGFESLTAFNAVATVTLEGDDGPNRLTGGNPFTNGTDPHTLIGHGGDDVLNVTGAETRTCSTPATVTTTSSPSTASSTTSTAGRATTPTSMSTPTTS
jgi:hypothetical protein